MPTHAPGPAAALTLALVLGVAVPTAAGQVYKCTDDAGRTTYSDTPCGSTARPLTLPGTAKGSATSPHMCAQLLDETNRLAAAAERDARQGRTESPGSTRRRQDLTRQYQTRCAAIAPSTK